MTKRALPSAKDGASVLSSKLSNVSGGATRWLLAASVGAIAIVNPGAFGVYGGRVRAQPLPAGCTDGGNDIAENGETVTCLPPPSPIDGISTTVDDLTVNVGNAGTPTVVDNATPRIPGNYVIGNGVTMAGGGSQTLNIYNAGSSVTGTTYAVNMKVTSGSGDLTLTSEGTLQGFFGVSAQNYGSGGTTVNVADVTGTNAFALRAATAGFGISVTSTGTVSGGNGIVVINAGTGAASVVANEAYGSYGDGIFAANNNGTDVSVTATGTVSGGRYGIVSQTYGSGAASVNAVDVTGGRDAVYAITDGTSITVTTTGVVTGGRNGVIALGRGAGAVTIDVNEVAGNSASGIFARNTGTDLSVTAAGSVYGAFTGIDVRNYGSGALTVDVADVEGISSTGIFAGNYNGTDLSVTATDAVTGAQYGIVALNYGSGAVTIDVAEVTATGPSGYGIFAFNDSGAGLSITATGAVSGSARGIRLTSNGTGDAYVNVGDVTGMGSDAVTATVGPNGHDLTFISDGVIDGAFNGFDIRNFGSGSLEMQVGDVSGAANFGIYAYTDASTTGLSITATGAVEGATGGVYAYNFGSGDTTITLGSGASVTGDTLAGIRARTTNAGADITVQGSSGDVVGATDGIYLSTAGADITVQNLDSVTGQAGDGIDVRSNGGGITITGIGTVNGQGGRGIEAFSGSASGAGYISIQGVGLVGGINSDSDGIRARAQFGAYRGDVNIGGVTAIGAVTSTGADGVFALGRNVTINVAGDVNSHFTGVGASGDGAVALTVGNVASTNLGGVFARTGTGGSTLSITSTGAVTASGYGVYADNEGSGDLSINVVNVTGGGTYYGVFAYNEGANLNITATGTVAGGAYGIEFGNAGTGAVNINVNTVAGGTGTGIGGFNSMNGTDLNITATGMVSSTGSYGINVANGGSGALTVNVVDVTGGGADGVFAQNGPAGTDLTIVATGDVIGMNWGVDGDNFGTGATNISVHNVTGMGVFGIESYNSGTDQTITATGAVSGFLEGVYAINFGSGAQTINVVDVTSQSETGVYARNFTGTDITITSTGTVIGANEGIVAENGGSGAVTIMAHDVTALAGGDDAIDAYNGPAGTTLSVTTTGTVMSANDDGIDVINAGTDLSVSVVSGSVTGFQSGIEAYNFGTGSTNVTIAAPVTGQTELGVYGVSVNGMSVTVMNGGSVTGPLAAIVTDGPGTPADTVTIMSGGSATGDVLLLAGDDTFNDRGGSFTNVFGGADMDTANFDNTNHFVSGVGSSVNSVQEVEIFNFNSGTSGITGTHTDVMMTTIAAGAILNAADGTMLSGMLTSNGTLNIGNSPGTMTVMGDVVFGPTSHLPIEIGGATNDLLVATGAVNLGGELDIIILGGLPLATPTTRTVIDGGTGLAGSFASFNSGLLISNVVSTDPALFDVLVTTTLNTASSLGGLTVNQANVGDNLIGLLGMSPLDPGLISLINAVGSIPDIGQLAAILEGLHPEGLDIAPKFLAMSQNKFIDLVMANAAGAGAGETEFAQLASLAGGPVARRKSETGPLVWAAFQASGVNQDKGGGHIGFDGEIMEVAAGVSGLGWDGPLTFGFAGGYSHFDGESDGALGDSAKSEAYRLGASLRAEINESSAGGLNAHLDSVVAWATGENDYIIRLTDPATMIPVSHSDSVQMSSLDWRTRFTLDGQGGRQWPVQPHVEVGYTAFDQDATTTGAGPTGLAIGAIDNSRASVGAGASLNFGVTDRIRFNGRATGVHYFGDTQNVFVSRFVSAPAGGATFLTFGKEVDTQVELEAALDYRGEDGFGVGVSLFGETGDLDLYGLNARLSKQF